MKPDILYFAYGSNLDRDQMAYRCPGAAVVESARLPGYRFTINSRGVATILTDSEDDVHGLLWVLTPENAAALDTYEGVAEGDYQRITVRIYTDSGTVQDAMTYIASDNLPGIPLPGYMERIVQGALEAELPETYIERLKRRLPR